MGGVHPRWRHDGKQLFYVSADRKMMAVPVSSSGTAFESGAPLVLFPNAPAGANRVFGYQPSTDGKKFLATVPVEGAAAAQPPVTIWLNWQAGLKK
jgi:hypothetical protein